MAMPPDVTTYQNVSYKDGEGTLFLGGDKLTFQQLKPEAQVFHVGMMSILKHQVSPASHPKALLKLNLEDGKSHTFRLTNRLDLEQLRKDVTKRLRAFRPGPQNHQGAANAMTDKMASAEFGDMDPTAAAVTRSSLLAANPTLRAQHYYLVTETQTVSEEDFWKTHQSQVEEEYAKICGQCKTGPSSIIQSHLVTAQGGNKITLGVEEMRQIFILYPAVHKAYEEKVPLELSDEQFWRKYLESEFFHRDRGRLGTAARNHASTNSNAEDNNNSTNGGAKKPSNGSKLTNEQQDARAAAVGTDDLFARYDQKLREASGVMNPTADSGKRKWGTHLAVGQFDLASTFETERGQLLEGPRDLHPPNADEEKNARVVRKYNRHWAMVLHPDDAVAGSDLNKVTRKSVTEVLPDDEDAKANGGVISEMKRLVNFANADELDANHVTGAGPEDENFESLNLNNIEAYSLRHDFHVQASNETKEDAEKRRTVFADQMAHKVQEVALRAKTSGAVLIEKQCFPESKWGRNLLSHLTKRMAEDAKTDKDCHEVVDRLDEEFQKKLDTYFRRSSELLRHFFGLQRLEVQGKQNEQKLSRIVQGLEAVYREMETVRKELPQNEDGEIMRKMCLPIMDQLDCAFKLHREAASGASNSGGFVDVS